MAIVIKKDRELYALIINEEQKALLENAFCSQWATHCINVKLRELNQDIENKFERKWFTTQKPNFSIKQVGVIVESNKIDILKGVQFFDNKKFAFEKLEKRISKNPNAKIITVELVTNIPKAQQKKINN